MQLEMVIGGALFFFFYLYDYVLFFDYRPTSTKNMLSTEIGPLAR